MTDPRPEPRYGQYADTAVPTPPSSASVQSLGGEPDASSTPKPPSADRKLWDVLLTGMLLAIGVYDVISGFGQFAQLEIAINQVFEQQGIGEFTSFELATTVGMTINGVRIALLAIALGWSLRWLSLNRVAFWIPLAAGVLAGGVALAGVFVLILIDPAFALYFAAQQQ